MRRLGSEIWRRLRAAEERPSRRNRQRGFALIVVTVTLSILGAVVGEFGYNARVELESSMNARDQLRAEYLARSGVNLARLLIKVQQVVLDKNRNFVGDVQIADFAPYLVKAFGGSDMERQDFGALLGISGDIKGLGVGRDGSFDVAMGSEDGKINVNCGGGLVLGGLAANPTQPPPPASGGSSSSSGSSSTVAPPITTSAQALYQVLVALFFPPRYNRMFDNPDAEGQYTTRDNLARAIIDWSDIDEQRFEPLPGGTGSEDYRYDGQRDPYRAHNNYYDTIDELNLVQGVGDDFYGSFGGMLTVYGGCKVNLNAVTPANWPITAALIRVSAKNPQNPILLDDVQVAALAQQIGSLAQLLGGIKDVGQFSDYAKSGGVPQLPPGVSDALKSAQAQQPNTGLPTLNGIELDSARLGQLATTGARTVYRVDATGKIRRPGGKCTVASDCKGVDAECTGNVCMMTRSQVHIRAVWDANHYNQNSTSNDANDRVGTWVYWRTE